MPASRIRLTAALGLAAALSSAGTAAAQEFFYREEPGNGRLLVFARLEDYQRWKATGSMTSALMRLGYGPRGETVLFDSPGALNLFNFRHGRSGEPSIGPTPPRIRVAWADGRTTVETDRALLSLSNRLQLRWGEERPSDKTRLSGTDRAGRSKGSFRLARVRSVLEGWIYSRRFEYNVQLDWADATSIVRDAAVNWDVRGDRRLQVKAGQFKVPFGRQELTSAMAQQFVDRSIVSTEFERSRDLGVQVWGFTPGTRWEYRAGIFNGNGRQRTLAGSTGNDNTRYQYDARLMFQPFGDTRYSESDFESEGRPLLALAVNAETNDARVPDAGTAAPGFARRVVGADVSFKYAGLSLMGEYFDRRLTPASGPSFKSNGYHAQAGYFLRSRALEVALRVASWDPSALVPADQRREWAAAVSWFHNRHTLKLNADLRRLMDAARDTRDHELRIQAQVIF